MSQTESVVVVRQWSVAVADCTAWVTDGYAIDNHDRDLVCG